MRLLLLAATWLAAGCYGVPGDAIVERLSIKAWGGNLGSCQEFQVHLIEERSARGLCGQVDSSGGSAVDPAIIDSIQVGIETSDFSSRTVGPDPGCPECPTRSYQVRMVSASEGASAEARILPSEELLGALDPLQPP